MSRGENKVLLHWVTAVVVLAGGLVATACGGRAYDPDVDGQSHWWRLCAEDVECGTALTCVCGVCTKPCDDGATCAGSAAKHACVAQAPWCEAPASGVCAAACDRASDCPTKSRCEDGTCVPELGPVDPPPPPTQGTSPTLESVVTSDDTDGGTDASEGAPSSSGDLDAGCGQGQCTLPPDGFCESVSDTAAGKTDAMVPGVDAETLAQWLTYCRGAVDASRSDSGACGNGIVDTASSEQCDDGNVANGDGCTVTCRLESCDGSGICCGDGVLDEPEQCDDGNVVSGDGCDSNCTIEAGYVCMPPGAPCVTNSTP